MIQDPTMSEDMENARDEGYSSEAYEVKRQAYAQAQCEGGLIGAYERSDYDIRAACLEAAVRIFCDGRDVLTDARAFHAFLTEAK